MDIKFKFLKLKNYIPFILLPLYKIKNIYQEKYIQCSQEKSIDMLGSLKTIEKKLDTLSQKTKYNIEGYPIKKENTELFNLIPMSVYRKYHNVKSEEGYSLSEIIINEESESTPKEVEQLNKDILVVPSFNTFLTFEEIYTNFIKRNLPQEDFSKAFENESYSMTKSLLQGMQEIVETYFLECDITTNRNLDGFKFTPKMTNKERSDVLKTLQKEISSLEKDIFKQEGKFYKLKKEQNSKDTYLEKCGVYNSWPKDRMIYMNLNSRLICLINEEDHLKIKYNSDVPAEMTNGILNYFELLESLEKKVNFAVHPKYGYLNVRPLNCGTATKFNLKIKVSNSKSKQDEIKKKLSESGRDLSVDIIEEESGLSYLKISNTNPFYTFSTLCIELLNIKDLLK